MFLRGTREHNTFVSAMSRPKERVLAYAVVLSGMEKQQVKGSIYELDAMQRKPSLQSDRLADRQ